MRIMRNTFGGTRCLLNRSLCLNRNATALLTVALAWLTVGPLQLGRGESVLPPHRGARQNVPRVGDYVGSKVCAQCHREIYRVIFADRYGPFHVGGKCVFS